MTQIEIFLTIADLAGLMAVIVAMKFVKRSNQAGLGR